jgi:hypothetical protein
MTLICVSHTFVIRGVTCENVSEAAERGNAPRPLTEPPLALEGGRL